MLVTPKVSYVKFIFSLKGHKCARWTGLAAHLPLLPQTYHISSLLYHMLLSTLRQFSKLKVIQTQNQNLLLTKSKIKPFKIKPNAKSNQFIKPQLLALLINNIGQI